MEEDVQFRSIQTDDSLMETAKHGDHTFPFKFYYEDMAKFDFHCVEWHWHTELEFVYMESGTMHCWIGDRQLDLSEGEGVFINSRVLHRMYSEEGAIIPNFLCLPTFVAPEGSLIHEKYIVPVIEYGEEYIVFSPEVPWQEEVLRVMRQIAKLCRADKTNELIISAGVQEIWIQITEHVSQTGVKDARRGAGHGRLQIMMQYIHDHYHRNLTLKEIADAAEIGKSTALNLFQSTLGTTPINYLIGYRLKEAAVLLTNTEKKIGAISLETGFHSVDHFCRTFKKVYRMTPTEYRKSRII